MKKNICLIDYGAGNLHSVYKAFKFVGADIEITKDPKIIEQSQAVVFPGVGAFGSVMKSIKENNLEEITRSSAKSKKPFLGICLGLQVLFDESEENPNVSGLKVFRGKVIRFKKAKKVPHIGWNDVSPQNQKYYFVHSYYVVPEDKNLILGTTDYDGEVFTSMIKKDNLLALQFHPEKSGDAGLELLKTFMQQLS